MDLTFEQIRSVTVGALHVFQEEDGIHFRRFSDSQMTLWPQLRELYAPRIICTAGCQLSFYTDSRTLLLNAIAGQKFEVWINGLPTHFFSLDRQRMLPVQLPEGEKHIVITLPNYSEGIIKSLKLDNGSDFRPYTYDRKFLFLGDSITQGAQSSMDSCCYAYRISRFFNAQILNQGVGTSRMHAEILEKVDFDPDVIFIAYGTNDYTLCPSLAVLEGNASAYFDRIKELYPHKPIYYISPLWRGDGNLVRDAGTLDDCRKVLIKQCEVHGFNHIDGYTLVPHSPAYFSDGYLHPNDLGFSLYAENLIKLLCNSL